MNISDSERIAGFLESQGLTPATTAEKANFVVINTCGVRQSAEDRVYGIIHNLRKQTGKRRTIILTGCLADRKDVQKRMRNKVDKFISIKDFFGKKKDYLCLLPKHTSRLSAYVPIMTGCNNFCAYCVVPYARGRETSRSSKDIIKEIATLAKQNYKEIILLGQNVNSYKSPSPASGRGIKGEGRIYFSDLLNKLARSYPEITFRFLTSHPKDFSEELIKVIAENKNIYREIHLPIQAGSNKILRAMNRPYTKKHYLDLIKKIKKNIPDASFTTDVIVGFPGETKKDFLDTVDIFKKVIYNEAYINKYSPRSGTAAWKLGDPIPLEEKKQREKVLRKLVKPDAKYRKEKNNEKTGK